MNAIYASLTTFNFNYNYLKQYNLENADTMSPLADSWVCISVDI